MCAPGGKVVVHSGLFAHIHNEDELAMILAHEIGHAVARHSAETFSLQRVMTVLDWLVRISFGDYVQGASLKILRLVMELPYSRKMEMEADYIGLVLMSRACFNPSYAPQFFLTVARMAPQENAFDALVSTHPSLADRSKRLRELIPLGEEERAHHCWNQEKMQRWVSSNLQD